MNCSGVHGKQRKRFFCAFLLPLLVNCVLLYILGCSHRYHCMNWILLYENQMEKKFVLFLQTFLLWMKTRSRYPMDGYNIFAYSSTMRDRYDPILFIEWKWKWKWNKTINHIRRSQRLNNSIAFYLKITYYCFVCW